MGSTVKNAIMIAIALIVIATILPLAIGLISNAGNTVINASSGETLSDVADASVVTLLTVLLPILAILAIVMYFLPKTGKKA